MLARRWVVLRLAAKNIRAVCLSRRAARQPVIRFWTTPVDPCGSESSCRMSVLAAVRADEPQQLQHARTSCSRGTAPLRWRLSEITRPPFRTSCSSRTLVMSSSGLAPSTRTRSDARASSRQGVDGEKPLFSSRAAIRWKRIHFLVYFYPKCDSRYVSAVPLGQVEINCYRHRGGGHAASSWYLSD